MSTAIDKQFQVVEQLIHNRNFTKAMTIIDGLLEKPKLTETKLLELQLVKSHIFSELEQFDEGLQLADEVLVKSEKLDDKLLIVDAIIAKLANLGVKEWWIGRELNNSYLYYKSSKEIDQYSKLISKAEKNLKVINKTIDKGKREAQLLRMKGIIHRKKEEHSLAYECFDKSLKYHKTIRNDFETLRDYVSIIKAHNPLAKMDLITEYKTSAIELNEKVKSDFYRVTINLISLMKGFDLEKTSEYYQDANNILKKLSDEKSIAWLNYLFGNHFSLALSDFDTALIYYNKGLSLFEILDYHDGVFITLIRIANVYRIKGDFKQAFDYVNKGIAIGEVHKIKSDLAYAYGIKGSLNQILGNLDEAFIFYNKCLELSEQGYSDLHYWVYKSIGQIYLSKNDFEKAKEFLIKANKTLVFLVKAQVLLQLVMLSIETASTADAQKYYQELKNFERMSTVGIITQYKLLAEALILKNSQRLSHQFQALKLFQEVAFADTTRFELTITALLNICELLLLELRTTNNEEIIPELEKVLNQLMTKAKEINSVLLFAEAYLLESKLAIIALDFEKAERLFDQAKELAKDKQLEGIMNRIITEQEVITKKIGNFKEFSEKETTIVERLDFTGINGNIEQMKKKNLTGILSEQEEDAVIRGKLFSLKL
ncbi:MAG: tetratricopeptide repeat protein [Asgard group archaeon]|nr:tetratricopeptide repeat protein [Asgard group archaeon]